jgi:hypothetical protein
VFGTGSRFAQTFVAAQSGVLAQLQVALSSDGSPGDYVVELLSVVNDVPTNTVLAGVVIPNAAVPPGLSTQTASFAGPPLVAGTAYAAALSRSGGGGVGVGVRIKNACPGRGFSQDPIFSGDFTELTNLGGEDLIVAVTVLA